MAGEFPDGAANHRREMEGGKSKKQGKEGWMKHMDDAVLYSFNDTKDLLLLQYWCQ
jgi:hypothetical protein